MRQLFTYEDRPIYDRDFMRALRSVGIVDGDVLFIHAVITSFGKKANIEGEQLLSALTGTITESVGENGTISMPTFTYSFCKGLPYDPAETPSSVGVLSEFFRKQPDVIRTRHPIFSAAVRGKKKDFLANLDDDSFDENSIFGRLRAAKAKLIFFGASLRSCTFLHHIEQIHGVSYRYMKTFSGSLVEGERVIEHSCTYYVLHLDMNIIVDTAKIEARLRADGSLKEARVGAGSIMAVGAEELFTLGMRMLDADPYSFILKSPVGTV